MDATRSGRAAKLLLPCVRASAGKIAAGLACALLAAGASLCIPWSIKVAVDDVFASRTLPLSTFVGALLAICVVKNIFVLAGRRVMLSVGEHTALMTRRLVFDHLQSLSTGGATGGRSGDGLSRITGDVSQVEGFVETGIPKMFTTLVMVAGVLAIVFWRNPQLAALSLSILPLHLLLYVGFRKSIKAGNRGVRERESGLASGLVESLLGAKAVTAATAEARERDRFFERAHNLLDSKLKLGSMRLWQKILADGAVAAGTAGVWFYGGRMVNNNLMQPGEFMAFVGYLGLLYPLSLTLMTQMGHSLGTVASAERIMDLLEKAPDVAESSAPTPLPEVHGEITFQEVGFSYSGGAVGIRGLTATIRPGQVVAIRGPVGSGKSTLAYLLARFYDVSTGKIYLDGVELGSLPLGQLRGEVGIVFQEPFIFADTITNNIRYPKPDADMREVAAAADAAGLAPLLEALPDGLDAMVGEGGVQLSLGQKRRIDMARALIKNPRIMILDSFFTDGDEEHQWEEARVFARISSGRTTFVIDPPPFILERAAKIIRLHRDGSVGVEDRIDRGDSQTVPGAADRITVPPE